MNISFQLSCNFTPFLGIYQEILLSCMILTYLCKIHNGVVFFVGSPDVMRPDKIKINIAKFLNLFHDISSCSCYLDIFNYLSYILTYVIIFLSLHLRRMYYHGNAWIKSYSFHLHGPCCEVSPFNENIFQSLKTSMEDVMVITWNIRIILLRHKLWW